MDTPPRTNGLHRPFHPFQIISWILQGFNIIAYYTITIPCLAQFMRAPIAVVFSILQILILIFGYKLSKSDPTDRIISIFRNTTDKA